MVEGGEEEEEECQGWEERTKIPHSAKIRKKTVKKMSMGVVG